MESARNGQTLAGVPYIDISENSMYTVQNGQKGMNMAVRANSTDRELSDMWYEWTEAHGWTEAHTKYNELLDQRADLQKIAIRTFFLKQGSQELSRWLGQFLSKASVWNVQDMYHALPETDNEWEPDNECEGHESLNGADMGVTVFCDGTCK